MGTDVNPVESIDRLEIISIRVIRDIRGQLNSSRLATNNAMDKKAKKRIEVLRKKISDLQPRIAGAKKQNDDPEELRQWEADLAAAQAELEKLKDS
jgi:predicted  nucleic acid-binding Zn-ribbon protein